MLLLNVRSHVPRDQTQSVRRASSVLLTPHVQIEIRIIVAEVWRMHLPRAITLAQRVPVTSVQRSWPVMLLLHALIKTRISVGPTSLMQALIATFLAKVDCRVTARMISRALRLRHATPKTMVTFLAKIPLIKLRHSVGRRLVTLQQSVRSHAECLKIALTKRPAFHTQHATLRRPKKRTFLLTLSFVAQHTRKPQ